MTEKREEPEQERVEAVREWTATPSENPRYKGATPGDVGRALLGKHTTPKGREDGPPVKSDV